MLIATIELQNQAILAIIQQLQSQGCDLPAVAEGAKLRILGSVELCMLPAEYRVRCAEMVDHLINKALQSPDGQTAEL